MVLTFPISSHSFSDGLAGTAPENIASVRVPRTKTPRCCNTKGDIRFRAFLPEKDYIRFYPYLTHSALYSAEVKNEWTNTASPPYTSSWCGQGRLCVVSVPDSMISNVRMGRE
jgi:hypothetical protein